MWTKWQEVWKSAPETTYSAQDRGCSVCGRVAKDWAAELWLDLADVYWARCNPDLVRITGVNNPRFNQSQGDDADHEFIKHIQRFLTPWDQAQTPPT